MNSPEQTSNSNPSQRAPTDAAGTPSVAAPARAAGVEWVGVIFKVDCAVDTLIVLPQATPSGLNIQKLQVEVNALKRKLETGEFKNVVIDMSEVNYFGSELIGGLIRLGRTATDRRGKAAFCAPSEQMLEVLESMRLSKLWPIVATRTEALQAVQP